MKHQNTDNASPELGKHLAVMPSIPEIRTAAERLAPTLVRTPVVQWESSSAAALFGSADVWLKLELFQVTGTFKPRGALNVAQSLDADTVARGFTAFSSGNHAAAVAFVAKAMSTTAKVVMPRSANPARVEKCRSYGAEIVFVEDGMEAAKTVQEIADREERTFIHPYEGPLTTTGTGTLGLEIVEQINDLDAVVVAMGGGGLCSGVGTAIKQSLPDCEVFAVEPVGADTMFRSFQSGKPQSLDVVRTIADTLAPPLVLPYSFEICRQTIDDIVLVSDNEMREAMAAAYRNLKLALEPGGAAAIAGMMGPLRERLQGKRVCVIVCGSNIDFSGFLNHLKRSQSERPAEE